MAFFVYAFYFWYGYGTVHKKIWKLGEGVEEIVFIAKQEME